MSIENCKVIDLVKISDPRGNLTVVESLRTLDFEIKRVYYLYDVPAGAERAGHAHKTLRQLLIPLAGSFDVFLDDGKDKKVVHLNRPNKGLLLSNLVWREISNFSSGSVCLVLASDYYCEQDYYRSYADFVKAAQGSK